MDALCGLVGQLAGDGLVANAAAVHNGNVNVKTHVVEQVVQRVGAEVAGIGLLRTNQTLSVCVVVIQRQRGFAYLCAELSVHIRQPFVLDIGDVFVNGPGIAGVKLRDKLIADDLGHVVALVVLLDLTLLVQNRLGDLVIADEVGGDRTGLAVNYHHADGVKVFAGLRQNNGIAVLIGHFLTDDGGVGVTVDEGVQPGNGGDNVLTGPRLGSGVVTQMTQSDNYVGVFLHGVNGCLHVGCQCRAVLSAGDTVDVAAVFILEVCGGGLGKGFGGGDADNCDPQTAGSLEDMRALQNALARDAVFFMVEVARNIGESGGFHV